MDINELEDSGVLQAEGEEMDNHTAELIAGWLVAKYRSRLIYDSIDEVFGELDDDDRDAVYESVCDIISSRYKLRHLEYIKNKLIDFFEYDTKMNIDGFVNFRLKAYKDELRFLVEECGSDILSEREIMDYADILDIINLILSRDR